MLITTLHSILKVRESAIQHKHMALEIQHCRYTGNEERPSSEFLETIR
jgi:hypothetical protein